jgi:predicted dehydrogenase
VSAGSHRPIGVAVVGFGWMGQVHTRAYARVAHHYPDLRLVPQLVTVVDPEPERAADAVERYGFAGATERWQDVLADDRVEIVSVTSPNFLHRQIGVAVASAGKHLWIEKPVGLNAQDAGAVAQAVEDNGVQSGVGFNYRNAPAVAQARDLIANDAIGTITNARIRFFSDYAAHPLGALSWRFERTRGGSGVLGDLASHAADLARYLLGEIDSVVADTEVFIDQRPRAVGVTSHFATAAGGEVGPVGNEDYVSCLMRFASGARGSLEASRIAVGEQNNYGFEIHGTKGRLAWDFRRMGELDWCQGEGYVNQVTSTLHVGPGQGDFAAFQPGAGIPMSYDDLKVIEVARLLTAVASGRPHGATAADAFASARTVDAIIASVLSGRWEPVPH